MTERLTADDAGIARAAELLLAGGTVALPTETVYGLGADATRSNAVAAIFAAKNRPSFNPLIVHVPAREEAEALALFDDRARQLARAFWPGPLTLVLPRKAASGLSELVTAGLPSVALRVPSHPVATALLRRAGRPLAAPSANPSGRLSPTDAAHVIDGLDGRIDAVLDAGPTQRGVESTILGVFADGLHLLRPGGVPVEQIEAIAGPVQHSTGGQITAPGQLASHYAPGASLRLNATQPQEGELWLGFGPDAAAADLNLSPSGDLVEAAANLFAALHRLDARAAGGAIAVAPIPESGLGCAINDRLRRAAAPRS